MDRAAFWELIDAARAQAGDDDDAFLELVRSRLASLGANEILDFQRNFHHLHAESYCWSLWGAAYLMNGGCSDDGFDYFRAGLISCSRRTFEAAVHNPDTLADLGLAGEESEEFMYVAYEADREAEAVLLYEPGNPLF